MQTGSREQPHPHRSRLQADRHRRRLHAERCTIVWFSGVWAHGQLEGESLIIRFRGLGCTNAFSARFELRVEPAMPVLFSISLGNVIACSSTCVYR